MSDSIMLPFAWVGFFVAVVWGHIGFKVAIKHQGLREIALDLVSLPGITAILAWGVSVLFWAVIVSRQPIILATSISNLRYPLICFAAVLLLGESLTLQQWIGAAIVLGGLVLMRAPV